METIKKEKPVAVADMDGVVVKTKRISHLPERLVRLVVFLGHWSFLFFSAKMPRSFFENYEVHIYSKRPPYCHWVTRLWFWLRDYPVGKVYCLGFYGDKRRLLKEEGIDPIVIIDDKHEENFGDMPPIKMLEEFIN